MTGASSDPAKSVEKSALDDAIYLISHDLQAPIRALCTIPEWIEEDLEAANLHPPENVRDHIKLMNTQGDRLRSMLKDLLTYSRVGRPQAPFNGDWVALWASLVARIPGLAEAAPRCSFSGTPEIGSEDLQNLMAALVSNSIKHGNTSDQKIEIEVEDSLEYWCLKVSDPGEGIPESLHEKAKKIFTTLKPRDEVEGSGMGLPIADKVCLTYGGTLRIETSDEGDGCVVSALFPKRNLM